MMIIFSVKESESLRCYTDLEATRVYYALASLMDPQFSSLQSGSLECGMATGCVKILKKAYEFDHLGKFIPENKRGKDVDLFRGEQHVQIFTLLRTAQL